MVVAGTVQLPVGLASCRAPLPRVRGRRVCVSAAQTVAESKPDVSERAEEQLKDGKAKIYVGKGRYVVDDPSKYPDRNELTGGFAGGEVRKKELLKIARSLWRLTINVSPPSTR